jgi:hypothetical protein
MGLLPPKEVPMTATMSLDQRQVLLNFLYDTDHLVWLYRAAIDRSPSTNITSEHMCLVDFASRAASLARSLLDEDNRDRDTRAGFKPTPSALRDRLRATLAARRQALQQHAAPAAPEPPPEPAPDDTPVQPNDPNFDPSWREAEPDLEQEGSRPEANDQGSERRRRMRPR